MLSTNKELEIWGHSIIQDIKRKMFRFGNKSLEFSVFYSPLSFKPKLMIIGDNPGGQMGQAGLYHIPRIHEYVDPDPKKRYLIANIMRDKILSGEKLNQVLTYSVKTNRIFFRTPDLATLNSLAEKKEIVAYCRICLDKIIGKIQPQNILAESFGAFKSLSDIKQVILTKANSNKALLLGGQYNGIPVFGINHPSRASFHKITNEDWELVNKELERLL